LVNRRNPRVGDPNDARWIAYMEERNAEIKKEEEDELEKVYNYYGCKGKYEEHMKLYKDEMTKRKQRIVEEYGTEPTVCFFHYLHNAVNYIGEEDLRKCFKSLVGQGDEVIIGDYGSNDDTKKIAEEYGFKVVDVEKVKGITLAQSKIKNKILEETKCNFTVECDIHVEYPKNITDIIKEWILNNDITKKMLVLRGLWINEDGNLQREYSFGPAAVFYRPYLLEARGYDERCVMGYGGTHYSVSLMLDVYDLEFDDQHLDTMIHKYHIPEKTKMLKLFYNIDEMQERHMSSLNFGRGLARRLLRDFDKEVKNVKNSYW